MSRRVGADSGDGLRRGAALIIVASSWQPCVSRRSKQPVKKSMLDAACAVYVWQTVFEVNEGVDNLSFIKKKRGKMRRPYGQVRNVL